jgi:predicted 2-oxoglutarate/Fe(II)-dependent dioxygenase YbiX
MYRNRDHFRWSGFMVKQSIEGETIFVLPNFLSADECDRYIALSESAGYDEATITTRAGAVMRKDVRDNLRVIHDDPALASLLYERAKPHLPDRWMIWQVHGFNERLRFYRYDRTQKFDLHTDGCFRRSPDEESLFTFMIYLNDGYLGGETNFYDNRCGLKHSIKPEKGKALVFWHYQLHEGAPLIEGRKYVLRTDVMYRRVK